MKDDASPPATTTPVSRPPLPRLPLIALVILVAVAVVGVLLAKSRSLSGAAVPVVTPGGPYSTPRPVPPPPKVAAVDLEFMPKQPQMPQPVITAMLKFAAGARDNPGTVRVSGQVENGPQLMHEEPLVKIRLAMLQHALRANGIKGERISTEVTRMNPGTMKSGDLDRIRLSLVN